MHSHTLTHTCTAFEIVCAPQRAEGAGVRGWVLAEAGLG